MRNAFINQICDLAQNREDLFLICGDLGYSVLEPFAERFPDRFLNVGVAEQNMTQVAAGLAREGYNVFTYSIGNFPTLRCMEQIRYDVCYHEASVKVVAVGAGYAYGPLGVSHHTTEDLAMLRSIPNMVVTAPGDAVEAKALAKFFADRPGPGYVRLNKAGEPRVHAVDSVTLELGQIIPVLDGVETAVLCTGALLGSIVAEVRAAGVNWAVYSAPFVSHLDEARLVEIASRFRRIVTVEEHQLAGGFGSAIAERLVDLRADGALHTMPVLHRVGIPNVFIGCSGSQEYLRRQAGLTLTRLFESAGAVAASTAMRP